MPCARVPTVPIRSVVVQCESGSRPRTPSIMMNPEVLQVVHEKDPWIEDDVVPTHRADASWPINIGERDAGEEVKKGRRKSWHAIKFERKRRKGIVEPGSPPEARQKRHSWWNIFAGQQWPR